MRVWLAAALAAVAAACTFSAPALAADYSDTNFHEDTIVGGLTIPTTAAWAPDGRVFIAEKSGLLKVLNPGESSATTILDISDQVNDAYDRGLLGLAVDTSFETNHYVYLLYTGEAHPLMADTDAPTFSRLVRIAGERVQHRLRPDDAARQRDGLRDRELRDHVAVRERPRLHPLRGALALDRHRRLRPRRHALRRLGRRVELRGVRHAGLPRLRPAQLRREDPAHRPERQRPRRAPVLPGGHRLTHVCTKIHSLAFRNPFRFKWRDDGTPDGELTIGDVGWNTREEVDRVGTPGHTYGWPCYEGTMHTVIYQDDDHCDGPAASTARRARRTRHVPPVYDYVHSATNAIIGGPIYPGGPYPDSYDGQMFFGDYSAGFLKVLDFGGGGTPTATVVRHELGRRRPRSHARLEHRVPRLRHRGARHAAR